MDIWHFIQKKIAASQCVWLLCVVESTGSSPGRQGFKMAVAEDGSFFGTIGGGIMEHKLVEKAKSMLQNNDLSIFLQIQHHNKEEASNQSGMICSGSQTIAFLPISEKDKNSIDEIITHKNIAISLSPKGFSISNKNGTNYFYKDESNWNYIEVLNTNPTIHIIGGGHISLALSQIMQFLNFNIIVYDDREKLNTLENNHFASQKKIISYQNISSEMKTTTNDYIVIMTIGYRTDKMVLKQIINNDFAYLGLLGSQNKIDTLFAELEQEGISASLLQKINAPIGINIESKTTQEIAISIAAEIILWKNKKSC